MLWNYITNLQLLGGAPATSYELVMDDGNGGSFSEVVGYTTPYTLNSYLITSGIVSGANYRVMYRAANVHGFGAFSNIAVI